MIPITLSESEKDKLRKNCFLHPDPEVQRRSSILLLCAHDISRDKVAEIFACHRNTVTNVLRRHKKDGLPGLLSRPRLGRRSELASHIQSIAESLEKNPVRSINEACGRIKEITGIVRKPSQVRSMLVHLGFKRRVSGAMPCPPKKSRKNTQWLKRHF